jgi:hypothetical protein
MTTNSSSLPPLDDPSWQRVGIPTHVADIGIEEIAIFSVNLRAKVAVAHGTRRILEATTQERSLTDSEILGAIAAASQVGRLFEQRGFHVRY